MPAPHANLEESLNTLRQQLERDGDTPLYRQIQQHLTQKIQLGDWPSGQPLPTIKKLTALLDVSEMTIRRALNDLADEGLIEARRGRGTVVAGNADRITLPPRTPSTHSSSYSTPHSPDHSSASLTSSPRHPHHQSRTRTTTPTERRLRIGVVFASLNDGYPFVMPMLSPLETGDDPVRLHIFHLNPHETDPNLIRHQLPLDELDGLILMSPVNIALLWVCQRRQLPYVLMFNDIADATSTCITCDYHTGIHDAIAHIAAHGYKRPALITAGDERFSTGQMRHAIHLAARHHHLKISPDRIVTADYTQQHGYDATQQLLQQSQPPDVIFYSSDHQACGGLIAASELSRSVPDDLAIIGAGALVGPKQWPQRLSTIDLSLTQMGQLAINAIQQQINPTSKNARRKPHPNRFTVKSQFVQGQTTPR